MDLIKAKRKQADITGISLLLMAAIAGLGYGYAFNEAYTSLHNNFIPIDRGTINGMLKLTLVSFILIGLLDLIVAWSLYLLFNRYNPLLSLMAAALRIVYTIILGIAISYLAASVELLSKNQPGANEVLEYLDDFLDTWSFGLIFFGLHMMLLAIVLYPVTCVPKFIPHLALFAGACYLLSNGLNHTVPAYKVYKETVEMILALPMAAGELALALWLLFKRKQFSN